MKVCLRQPIIDASNAASVANAIGSVVSCHWVSCLNEFSDFDGKATHTISASLRYGVDLVGTMHSKLRHDQKTCDCESCVWMRDSQRLIDEFDERFATNRYRHLY